MNACIDVDLETPAGGIPPHDPAHAPRPLGPPRLDPPIHLKLRGKVDPPIERLALRAVLTAAHLLGLSLGTHLRMTRGGKDPLADLEARLAEAELKARLAWDVVELQIARFAKVSEKHRPYFSPNQRFRILELKNLLAWSAKEAARVFLVCANTIHNWERDADPDGKTVGSTVKPVPPVRRFADVVEGLGQTMLRLGFGGDDMISAILARAGWTSPRGRFAASRRGHSGLPRPRIDRPGPCGPSSPASSITSG